jgi:hypothetical protein
MNNNKTRNVAHQKVQSGQSITGEKHPYLKYNLYDPDIPDSFKSCYDTMREIHANREKKTIPLVDIVGFKFTV